MTHYLLVKIRELVQREAGQDLVEYALVIALIALGASAGMKQVATAVTTTFSNANPGEPLLARRDTDGKEMPELTLPAK